MAYPKEAHFFTLTDRSKNLMTTTMAKQTGGLFWRLVKSTLCARTVETVRASATRKTMTTTSDSMEMTASNF